MSKAFYSDYVKHCLRYYFRHPSPRYKSSADEENWKACKYIVSSLSDEDREILTYIYTEADNIPDNVYQIALEKGCIQDDIWRLLNNVEKLIAEERGLV